jgi:zinc D-Ala-D-Ala dipeptidase
MKPYKLVPIQDCEELLIPIPADRVVLIQPHAYEQLGAPYAGKSPFYLRQGVVERLLKAQDYLETVRSGWQIQVFDAYRPLAVQQFMVDYTFTEVVQRRGQEAEQLTEAEREALLNEVYEFWAVPDANPAQPPPHSTGGAVDVTLIDATGRAVDMGSPIDELSPRSYPDHYRDRADPAERQFDQHRELLCQVMQQAGFLRHWGEWWHFCYGDQMWAWLKNLDDPECPALAIYGRVPE